MFRKIIFIGIFSPYLGLKAQIPLDHLAIDTEVFGQEKTHIVTNSVLLLAGERLQYQAFNLSDKGLPSTLSKIMYVSLHDMQDSVIFQHKLSSDTGTAHGSFFIPTSLKTGVYKLLCYTNFSLNNLQNPVAQKDVYIINSFVQPDAYAENKGMISVVPTRSEAPETLRMINQSVPANLSIKTDKPTYQSREKITLKIKDFAADAESGNYLLSVRRVDPIQVVNSNATEPNFELAPSNVYHLPELRGELLSGRVINTATERPVAHKEVAFTIPGSAYVFKIAKTNGHGQFFISVDEPYSTTHSIVQVMGKDRGQYKLIIDEKKLANASQDRDVELKLDPGVKTWLQERSIQIQIENAYFDDEKITVNQRKPAAPFYGSLGAEFILEDYTRFPTLKETFVEIIRWARVRKKAGEEVFDIFDSHDPYNVGPYSDLSPVVLVDGILMQSAGEVLNISADAIKSVQVIPEPYRYGPTIFRGIIDIRTSKERYRPPLTGEYIKEFALESPLLKRQYPVPDYAGEARQRIPDYRVQLFWKPTVRLISAEHMEHFYASDVPGTYQIVLEGFAASGDHIVVKEYFAVE